MTKEFKKITNRNETRYVIESMTAGATGASAIATAPGRLGKLQKRLQELKDKVPQKPRQGPLRPQTGAGVHKNKKKDQQRGIEKHKGQSVYQEEFNGEYDDEAGMAESNLHTLARAVKGLIDTIDSNDNLPEWCQEKIAKAELMLVSVWDYLLSQKEQGIDPEQGVEEAFSQAAADKNKIKYQKAGRIGHGVGWKEYGDDYSSLVSDIVNKFDNITRLVQYDQAPEPTKYKIVERFFKKYGYPFELFNDVIIAIEKRVASETTRYSEQGVAEGLDQSPENEMLHGRIGSVLIKLYDKGYTEEKIRMMQDRIAKHLGYEPNDKMFQSAFDAALTNPEQGVAEDLDEGRLGDLARKHARTLAVTGAAALGAAGGAGIADKANTAIDRAVDKVKTTAVDTARTGKKVGGSIEQAFRDTGKIFDPSQITTGIQRGIERHGAQKEGKIKGADGKACWKGKRYAGTKNGKDICIPVGENNQYIEKLRSQLDKKVKKK